MKFKIAVLFALAALTLQGCDQNDADVVSRNTATAAANFEVARRVVFYNVRSGDYMLSIEGLCAMEDKGQRVEITCKTGANQYKKHFLGLTTEVTYFIEQTDASTADPYHYRVVFKPSTIIPAIEIR